MWCVEYDQVTGGDPEWVGPWREFMLPKLQARVQHVAAYWSALPVERRPSYPSPASEAAWDAIQAAYCERDYSELLQALDALDASVGFTW